MLGQAERLYELNSMLNPTKVGRHKSKILSISSGKGGTGKSFLASNLANELSQIGLKVLLIDFDINLANQNVIFNASSKKSLYDYITYNQNLDDIIFCYTPNLHLIFGESGKLDHPKLGTDKVGLFIDELRNLSEEYDYIIVDTSSGIEEYTLKMLLSSDEILLVSSTEPTSVMDGYALIKLLNYNGFTNKIDVIINKAFSKHDANEAFENLKMAVNHFLKQEINFLGYLDFSVDAVKSIQSQTLLNSYDNSSILLKQIRKISHSIKKNTDG